MHGRRTAPAGLRILKKTQNPWYEVRLIEGRQNQIRVMFKHFGHLVEKLKRIRIGFLDLGALKAGVYRTLTNSEVEKFKKLLDTPPESRQETFPKPEKRSGSGFIERATGYNEKRWAAERKAAFGEGETEPEGEDEDRRSTEDEQGAGPHSKREQGVQQRPQMSGDRQRRFEPGGSSGTAKPRKFPPKRFTGKPFSKPSEGLRPGGGDRNDERSSRGPAPRQFASKPFSPRPFAKSGPRGKASGANLRGGRPSGDRGRDEGQDRSPAGPPRTQFSSKPFSARPFSRSGPSGKASDKPGGQGRGPSGQGPSNQGPSTRGPGPSGQGRGPRRFSSKPFSKPGSDRNPQGGRGRGPKRGGDR